MQPREDCKGCREKANPNTVWIIDEVKQSYIDDSNCSSLVLD